MSALSSLRDLLRHAPRLAARGLIKIYRYSFSALVGFHCRHLPTCSCYADEAIDRFGLWAGGWMTLARLLRCHPFGTAGLDLVPPTLPARSCWYLPWRYGLWRRTYSGPLTAPSAESSQGAPATPATADPDANAVRQPGGHGRNRLITRP
jgi:putative membrane protein insertion efficiency factor